MPVAREGGSEFIPAPAGAHVARCIGCVSLGTQQPNNPQFNATFKILLIWELPDELLPNGQAMTVSKEMSCSLSEKANLRHMLESWRGRAFTREELAGFDVAQVIDVPCLLNVIHKQSAKGRTYADVVAASKLPKNMAAKPRVNDLVHYEIEDGANDVFKALPEFIRKKIASSAEWIESPRKTVEKPAPDGWDAEPDAPTDDEPPIDTPF